MDHERRVDFGFARNASERRAVVSEFREAPPGGCEDGLAHRLAERLGPDSVIVTLAVDSGFKYLSVSPLADL